MNDLNLLNVIDHINPAELNYQEWVNVGMALKQEGFSVDVWDTWSRNDHRYHNGECRRKWNTFRGTGTPVTGGTIVQIAKDHGWVPELEPGHAMDWDDFVSTDKDCVVIDQNWIEGQEIIEPGEDWKPVSDLIAYLETLFEPDDKVGYVTRSQEKDGKKYPDKGCWDRTAKQLINKLKRCKGDIGSVLGDYDPEVGAWIRFNPLDGNGCKNDNVTDFRYALVESDSMDLEKQNSIIRELELPVATLVFSGKKSLHAIVRIDAWDYTEYRKRVDYLYDICRKNGLDIDRQNRNPSRLSRMPGVIRNGKKQFLIDTNIGKGSWDEWKEWIESINDDLPDQENLQEIWGNIPELAESLINGVLRKGHKMLLAGPSKAGKSFALIELVISIAEGRNWLGFDCAKGKVLYVNLELDRASCFHRFQDVYASLGWNPENLHNIDIWNLRGKSVPMDVLAPKLIRRAAKKDYMAIIIDPIYKVITGDENSADQMAKFCNQFDKICNELGTAVIYCHHHSKGEQGGKRSMDRASGSGVFARDPDAILDLIELEPSEAMRKQEENKTVCTACEAWLKEHRPRALFDVSQDDLCSSVRMVAFCKETLSESEFQALEKTLDAARKKAGQKTAWRIDGTLREFPKFEPLNCWFEYPIHYPDKTGALGDIQPDAAPQQSWKKNFQKNKKTAEQRSDERVKALDSAFQACNMTGQVTIQDMAEYMGTTEKTVRRRIKESASYDVNKNIVTRS